MVFTGLSGASLTVTGTGISGGFAALEGFQIVNTAAAGVPEPSAWATVALGSGLLGGMGLRRRAAQG